MARKLLILLGLIFVFSGSASAQRVQLFGGYSYERLGASPARNLNGVEISAEYKFIPWIGLLADFDGQFGLPSQPDGRTLHFMVGPQISLPTRISPFFHVLGGFGHISDAGIRSTSFSTAIGGGIDLRILPLFSWRVVQGDDVITDFFGSVQHSARISTGIVFRF